MYPSIQKRNLYSFRYNGPGWAGPGWEVPDNAHMAATTRRLLPTLGLAGCTRDCPRHVASPDTSIGKGYVKYSIWSILNYHWHGFWPRYYVDSKTCVQQTKNGQDAHAYPASAHSRLCATLCVRTLLQASLALACHLQLRGTTPSFGVCDHRCR